MKINQFILKRKNYIFGLINSSKLGKPTGITNQNGIENLCGIKTWKFSLKI